MLLSPLELCLDTVTHTTTDRKSFLLQQQQEHEPPFMLKTVVRYITRFVEEPTVPSFSNVSLPARKASQTSHFLHVLVVNRVDIRKHRVYVC